MRFNLAAELIKFQDGNFGKSIEDILNKIREIILGDGTTMDHSDYVYKITKDKKSNLYTLGQKLSVMIATRTGIKNIINYDSMCPGAVMIFPFNRNHTLLKDYFRDKYHLPGEIEILRKSLNKKGTVDLEKGTIGGIFSEYEHEIFLDLYLNFALIDLTVEECTAILMHELGHAFTYYELSDRLNTTNMMLSELDENIRNGNDTPSKREYIFKEISGSLNLSNDEFVDLINEKNKVIMGRKLFSLYVRGVKSLRDTHKYDETSSEYLADNFAVKQGYGRYLLTGLDKLYVGSAEKSNAVYYLSNTFDSLFNFVLMPVMLISSIGTFVFPVLAFFAVVNFLSNDLFIKDMTYDELKTRYERIRFTLVGKLKDSKLSKTKIKDTLDDLEIIDKIISETRNYETLFSKFVNFILPGGRKVRDRISMDNKLENLANNDLYVFSAKLKTM